MTPFQRHLLSISTRAIFRRKVWSRTDTKRKYCTRPTDDQTVSPLKNAVYMGVATAFGVTMGNLIPPYFLPPKEIVFERDKDRSGVDPCARELQSFYDCARTVRDTKECEALYTALRSCRKKEGVPPKPPRK